MTCWPWTAPPTRGASVGVLTRTTHPSPTRLSRHNTLPAVPTTTTTTKQTTKLRLDNAMKALQAITNRRSQREAKEQQERKKVAQAAADLEATLANAQQDEQRLAAQRQEMEAMGAAVVQELDKGDSEAGGPEPTPWHTAMQPLEQVGGGLLLCCCASGVALLLWHAHTCIEFVSDMGTASTGLTPFSHPSHTPLPHTHYHTKKQALPAVQLQHLPELQAKLQQQRELLLDTPAPAPSSADGSSSGSAMATPEQQQQLQLLATFAWMLADDSQLFPCPSAAVAQATFHALCYGCNSLSLAAYNRLMAWCGEQEVVAGRLVGWLCSTCWSLPQHLGVEKACQHSMSERLLLLTHSSPLPLKTRPPNCHASYFPQAPSC